MRKQVLLLGNPLDHEGGMVEFNRGLINTIKDEKIEMIPFTIGSRMYLFYYPFLKRVLYPFYFIVDLIRFVWKLIFNKPSIVQVNPSLIPVPLIRDGLFVFITGLFSNARIVIVLHGWKEHIYNKLEKFSLLKNMIVKFFNSGDIVYVLSNEFKTKLIKIGVDEKKVKITTTFFYKDNIVHSRNSNNNSIVRFVFLGRVSKLKGIDELIEALSIYSKRNNAFECKIIGHGDKPGVLEYYKNYVEKIGLSDKIIFLGRKTGTAKYELLSNSDIYLFPSYMEGCPTSVIEALASGLFVVSSNVGALKDLINESNGVLVNPKSVIELANAIECSALRIGSLREAHSNISNDAFNKYEVGIITREFLTTYYRLLFL